ncbi:MAG TPA: Rid family hydrolase [Chitinispirillaceae bacterium]|nr:Rid family hydrolase [Chitinispirillaceae bacterium]
MQTSYETQQRLKCSRFSTESGAEEYYIVVTAHEGISFYEAIEEIAALYEAALLENGLEKPTLQMIRFYLSDITNDFPKLAESELFRSVKNGAVSLVGQKPVNGGVLGIIAYHIKSNNGYFSQKVNKELKDYKNQHVFSAGKNYSMLWNTCLVDNASRDSEQQTVGIFDKTRSFLDKHGMTIRNNTVRTWIYCRDVDNNYAGMVKARRDLFNTIGLTHETRYIASTGIEGKTVDPGCLVVMDTLSIGNICEEQLIRIEAPENLSSTHHYGVTFERGTRICFGDRSHLHISGTASIDPAGNIVFPGDVRNQLQRTIDNVEALLASQNADLTDMQYLILYLRDPKSYPLIEDILSLRIPSDIPLMIVEGPVCRPGWLVEIEGVGIIHDNNEFPVFN